MSIHNVLDQLRAANRMAASGDSLTMSGLDSVMIDASVIGLSGTALTLHNTNVTVGTLAATASVVVQGDRIKLGTSSHSVTIGINAVNRVGFWGATPIIQPGSTVTAPTLISAASPSAATSAINSTSNTSATVGFSSLNNFRTTIQAISTLQTQMTQVLNVLSDIGLTK